jgi:hypothetical protein
MTSFNYLSLKKLICNSVRLIYWFNLNKETLTRINGNISRVIVLI